MPLGMSITLPAVPQLGSDLNNQFTFGLVRVYIKPAGIWINGFQSGGPASSKQTLYFPSALNLFAKTHPDQPAPTII